MTRLLILVEGQSEEVFVKRTLAPYLAELRVYVQQRIVLITSGRLDWPREFAKLATR